MLYDSKDRDFHAQVTGSRLMRGSTLSICVCASHAAPPAEKQAPPPPLPNTTNDTTNNNTTNNTNTNTLQHHYRQ